MGIFARIQAGLAEGAEALGSAFVSLGDLLRRFAGGEARRDTAFAIAMIALSAKMAKADGVVSRSETDVFCRIFTVAPGEAAQVSRFYNLAKRDVAGFEAYARDIARIFHDDAAMLEDILDGLFDIARADGAVHPREIAYLERVAAIFGFDDHGFARIRERHVIGAGGDPYLVLGADPSWDAARLRRRYLQLVAENHPDRLAGRGVPDRIHPHRQRPAGGHQRRLGRDRPDAGARLVRRPVMDRPSPNQGERAEGTIDILLLHYTQIADEDAALAWLRDPEKEVSSHYFIYEDGRIAALVPEERRAWHAGIASWGGAADINSRSVGIEISNPGHAGGMPTYPPPQIDALIELCRDIVGRHPIPPQRVLGHSDVAPGRKSDPGETFPWAALAAAGIGLWRNPPPAGEAWLAPGDRAPAVEALQGLLALYGYGIGVSGVYGERTSAVVTAFQRHFRTERIDGRADRGTLEALKGLISALA